MKTPCITSKAIFCRVAAAILPLFLAGGPAAAQEATDDSDCQLILEGDFVEHLTLQKPSGEMMEFDQPGQSLTLPAGRYQLREIRLEGGFRCLIYGFDEEPITLTPDEPYHLEVGGPLTPEVKVRRWGTSLRMEYQLLDASGREFVGGDHANQPQFAVYQGDEKIGSGSFRYG